MSKKTKKIAILVFGVLLVGLLVGALLVPAVEKEETIQETMKDAVLHETNHVSFFGLEVNPGLISAFVMTGIILVFCLIVRIFVIPKFKVVPGKFQMLLEQMVGLFDGIAKSNSPHSSGFLGAYIFTAGFYIFFSTIFEMVGLQVVTTNGVSVSLPAPLSDINGAIGMGVCSFLVILGGGIYANKARGALNVLKDFSLPISMSFRLFGALLSGLLVTELVYYSESLSYGLPIFVGVMFTLLHALIQAYVLITLTALFFGEVTEPSEKKPSKRTKKHK